MRIPGYDAAIALERKRREEAYLSSTASICGVPIRQVTPRLLAILTNISTPYLGGSDVTSEDTLFLLWVLFTGNPMRKEKATWFRRTAKERFVVKYSSINFEQAEAEIWEFLESTFMDAPQGRASVPYASGVAWMEYSMSAEPFRWLPEYTLEQPIRRIYQLIRCRSLDHGATLVNEVSDRVNAEFLAKLQKELEGKTENEKIEIINRVNRGGNN